MMAIDLSSPQSAEASFYAAFQQLDYEAMELIWDTGSDILCVHPWAASLMGTEAVMSSWRAILRGGGSSDIRHRLTGMVDNDELALHHGEEHLTFNDGVPATTVIVVTNAFRRTADGWRMFMHHGSPVRGAAAALPMESKGSLH